MKIERLNATHYDEIIGLLNTVFSKKNNKQVDFEKEMPKMCIRDDEHMGRHIGIFENGRLVACMGIYPFEAVVAGQRLVFATTGNIAVRPECEGRGYMGEMLNLAMRELERLNVDVARLGGLRSRYNRYGFESCGQSYTFKFTEKNRERKFPEFKNDVDFIRITPESTEALCFTAELYNKNAIAVERTADNAYLCLSMWLNTPYLTLRNGCPIGYLSASDSGESIAELFAVDTAALSDMLCAWQKKCEKTVSFQLQPHNTEAVRLFCAVCESSSISSPSHFKIRNWQKTVDAFMKLKASYCDMLHGELLIGIADYGTVRLFVGDGGAGCELTDREPDVMLDSLEAARYIFGPYPPICTAAAGRLADAWFPLPLSWNGQDRV